MLAVYNYKHTLFIHIQYIGNFRYVNGMYQYLHGSTTESFQPADVYFNLINY